MSVTSPAPSRLPWRLLAFTTYIALACLRLPNVTRHGRLWAEEGTLYFTTAWTHPWWAALTWPAMGYLNLIANAAALLARYLVPLQSAPHVTFAIALAVQTIPALLLITAKDAWLRPRAVLIAAILILAMPPGCDEVWLNTANSQFHIALAAALCLVLDTPGRAGIYARSLLLFIAPLTSPASIALAPLFAARAIIDRDRTRALQATCIATGTILQLAFFYTPQLFRGHIPGPATLASIIAVKHLAIPFLGEQPATLIGQHLQSDIVAAHYPIAAILVVAIAAACLLAALAIQRQRQPMWLVLAGSALACLSYYGAVNGGITLITAVGSNRYAFAPSMLFALAILSFAATNTGRAAKIAWFAVIWLLTIATLQTALAQPTTFKKGPSWASEVAHWRADPTHALAIWPTGWAIHLRPH